MDLKQLKQFEVKPTSSRENLDKISNPPTESDLATWEDVPSQELPTIYKRKTLDRLFVNRDLRLDRIKWMGFDMDYTLAQYKTPAYEELSYDLLVERLIQMGYPDSISTLKYDISFPIRGLLLDTHLGHLVKMDMFGHIMSAIHGRTKLTKQKISEIYPSLHIPSNDIGRRFYAFDTLFNLPEACLYADLVDHLENNKNLKADLKHSTDDSESAPISYLSLFQDVRVAMDYVHGGQLKKKTLEDLPKYVKKNQLAVLLDRLRKAGIKSALITNSDFFYTNQIMNYLLEGQNPEYKNWREYYDVVIVSARKPTFFGEGTTLREVVLETGNLGISTTNTFVKGKVYSGGSLHLFEKFTGVRGNQVLYVGDHIYADIIKSKKRHAWRNLLIIPELEHELIAWENNKKLYNHLLNLEYMKAEAFRNLDSQSTTPPDVSVLRRHIKQTVEKLNDAYNPYFGSLFRSGAKQSLFSMQVLRYADLYTYDVMNLLNYPLFYHFTASSINLPHEDKFLDNHV